MKKHKYSDYENYILTADKCGLRLGYESFLDFKVIVSFIKEIASKTGDTFLHNGTIYNKKITSEAAKRFLDNLKSRYPLASKNLFLFSVVFISMSILFE